MKNTTKISQIIKWQTCSYVHPLTCGNEECRGSLTPKEEDGSVILVCEHCNNYKQKYIPECVYKTDCEGFAKDIEKLLGKED